MATQIGVQLSSKKSVEGLCTNANPLHVLGGAAGQAYQPGRTVICQDTNINRDGMIGNRRGFDYSATFASPVTKLLEYQNGLIAQLSNGSLLYSTTGNAGANSFNAYSGTYLPPSGGFTFGKVINGNLYFTSSTGIQKISNIASTPVAAGLVPALDTRASLTGTGGGFLSGASQVGYRVIWCRFDNLGTLLQSAPAQQQTIVTNASRVSVTSLTSAAGTATATTVTPHGFSNGDSITIAGASPSNYNGTYTIAGVTSTTFTYSVSGSPTSPATGTITAEKYLNVSLTFSVPFEVQVGDLYQIYRTFSTPNLTVTLPDAQFLLTQGTYTSGRTINYTDNSADTALQQQLYTNATSVNAGGLAAANYPPPFAQDVEVFQNYAIYANTSIPPQLNLQLLGTGGLTAGVSTITLSQVGGSSRTYNFNTSENAGTHTAQIVTSFSSPAQNVAATAQSLVFVINQDTGGFWYAEYASSPTDLPGKLRIWARTTTDAEFTVIANSSGTGNAFSPALPTVGSSVISTNDKRINRLFYSAFSQPDAVPLLNTIDVGRRDKAILRVLTLRNTLFILKEDGIFTVTGFAPSTWTPQQLDLTSHLLAPQTAQLISDTIIFLANEGFIQLNESGGQIISRDIEDQITALMLLPNLSTVSFAAVSEVDRLYICWVPQTNADTWGKVAYVYNNVRQQWVTWTKQSTAALTNDATRVLFMGSGLENALLYWKNTGADTDYSDEANAVTITNVTGKTITFTITNLIFPPLTGYALVQGASEAKVVRINSANLANSFTVTVDRVASFANGAATLKNFIKSKIVFPPDTCGEAGIFKHFGWVDIAINAGSLISQATMYLTTNVLGTLIPIFKTRQLSFGWGSTPWGTNWGDSVPAYQAIPFRASVPLPDNRGESLVIGWEHSVADEPYFIQYVSTTFTVGSEKTSGT